MTKHRKLTSATALIGGSLIVVGGLALAPALAYPPGTALTISCDAETYAPSATAVCTLSNINPAGPNSIALGDRIGAQGEGVTIVAASVSAQAATFVQDVSLPAQTGTYEVVGTSAGETATTSVKVVATGQATAFSVKVQDDGSVLVEGATAGCSVTVFVNGEAVGTATADANGTLTIDADVPDGATVTAAQTAGDGCAALESPAVVAGGSGSGGGATTPKTGANVTLGVVAGLGALGLGGGLFVASRRKKV